MRRYCLSIPAPPCSPKSLQQIRQSDQIFVPEEASPGGDLYERVDTSDIRTARHNRLQVAFAVKEKRTILTPRLVIFDQLELVTKQRMKRMRYPKMLWRTALKRCT